jgi:predicted acyl esterase
MEKRANRPAPTARRHVPAQLRHPRSVATLGAGSQDDALDQPFEEGVHDAIDADLRHRLISEAAFELYRQRGFADGYDLDDWLAAEAQVDHLQVQREQETGSGEG